MWYCQKKKLKDFSRNLLKLPLMYLNSAQNRLVYNKTTLQRTGGDIRVFSKKEKGSIFVFCIPVEEEHLQDLELAQISNKQAIKGNDCR